MNNSNQYFQHTQRSQNQYVPQYQYTNQSTTQSYQNYYNDNVFIKQKSNIVSTQDSTPKDLEAIENYKKAYDFTKLQQQLQQYKMNTKNGNQQMPQQQQQVKSFSDQKPKKCQFLTLDLTKEIQKLKQQKSDQKEKKQDTNIFNGQRQQNIFQNQKPINQSNSKKQSSQQKKQSPIPKTNYSKSPQKPTISQLQLQQQQHMSNLILYEKRNLWVWKTSVQLTTPKKKKRSSHSRTRKQQTHELKQQQHELQQNYLKKEQNNRSSSLNSQNCSNINMNNKNNIEKFNQTQSQQKLSNNQNINRRGNLENRQPNQQQQRQQQQPQNKLKFYNSLSKSPQKHKTISFI